MKTGNLNCIANYILSIIIFPLQVHEDCWKVPQSWPAERWCRKFPAELCTSFKSGREYRLTALILEYRAANKQLKIVVYVLHLQYLTTIFTVLTITERAGALLQSRWKISAASSLPSFFPPPHQKVKQL